VEIPSPEADDGEPWVDWETDVGGDASRSKTVPAIAGAVVCVLLVVVVVDMMGGDDGAAAAPAPPSQVYVQDTPRLADCVAPPSLPPPPSTPSMAIEPAAEPALEPGPAEPRLEIPAPGPAEAGSAPWLTDDGPGVEPAECCSGAEPTVHEWPTRVAGAAGAHEQPGQAASGTTFSNSTSTQEATHCGTYRSGKWCRR
jgi:hypothetical protein